MSAAEVLVDDDHRTDLIRVRGFALACCGRAAQARADLDATVDALVQTREGAEAALERCRRACNLAERMSVFAARAMIGDVELDTLAEAANAIAELAG